MMRYIGLIWILLASIAMAQETVRIYLPHEKTVDTDRPQLGQVAMILGDEALVEKAAAVKLGQFSAAGQQLLVDRQTILSCLAGAGIDAGQVQFNGTEMVRVGRDEKTILADRFVETARLFLEQQLQDPKPASLKLLRPPQDLVLTNASGVELTARPAGPPTRGVYRIIVAVMQQGLEIGHQELAFAAQYEARRSVAARRLEAGAEITPEDVKIETYLAPAPSEKAVFLPYGMLTKKTVEAGRPLEAGHVEAPTSPVLIKRQQQVVLKIETELMQISAYGEAMEDGKPGELIRVRRGSRATQDERFVIGKVMPDGTVQPVLN